MAIRKTTPKVRPQSAGENLEHAIRSELEKIPVPQNPFCCDPIAEVTLDNVRDLMAFLDHVELLKGDAANVASDDEKHRCVIRDLRVMGTDAIRYTHELVSTEDEMRGAARRQALEHAETVPLFDQLSRLSRSVESVRDEVRQLAATIDQSTTAGADLHLQLTRLPGLLTEAADLLTPARWHRRLDTRARKAREVSHAL